MREAQLTVNLAGFTEWAARQQANAKDRLVQFAMSFVVLVEQRIRRGGNHAVAPFSDAYNQASQWFEEPSVADMDEVIEGLGDCWERKTELLDWYTKAK